MNGVNWDRSEKSSDTPVSGSRYNMGCCYIVENDTKADHVNLFINNSINNSTAEAHRQSTRTKQIVVAVA